MISRLRLPTGRWSVVASTAHQLWLYQWKKTRLPFGWPARNKWTSMEKSQSWPKKTIKVDGLPGQLVEAAWGYHKGERVARTRAWVAVTLQCGNQSIGWSQIHILLKPDFMLTIDNQTCCGWMVPSWNLSAWENQGPDSLINPLASTSKKWKDPELEGFLRRKIDCRTLILIFNIL